MDRSSLLSGSDGKPRPRFVIDNDCIFVFLLVLAIPMISCLWVYMGLKTLQNAGRTKFSLEPVVYTGLDVASAGQSAGLPSFNVTLHAKSTYRWVKFCSSGPARMEVAYSGVTFAMADVEPFCVDPKGEKVIKAAASTGWPVLPSVFQERMDSDRRHGGVPVEVGFSFSNTEQAGPYVEQTWWVRCRTKLDADQPCSCEAHTLRGC